MSNLDSRKHDDVESILEEKPSSTSIPDQDKAHVSVQDNPHLGADDVALEEDVFGNSEDADVDFRGVTWQGAAFLLAKLQIGLGILGLPKTLATLGFVPGMIVLVVLSAITFWTGIIIGDFRNKHPGIHSIGDAAFMLFGKAGREFSGVFYWLLYVFCAGSAALGSSQALNALSDHGLCTVVFTTICAIVCWIIGSSLRTLKYLSWVSFVALVCISLAVWITAIACLTQGRPAAAAPGTVVAKNISAFAKPSFVQAMAAVSTQLFSLGGAPGFFTIHAEMRNPLDYRKALVAGQSFVIFNYIAIAAIMYAKVGDYITSPALGSAGPLFKKIGFGIALPGLLYACFFQAHLAGKYTFVRALRGTRHLQHNTMVHWAVWLGSMFVAMAVAFIVANAIPFFGDLVGLIGSFLMPPFVIIIPVCLWLHSTGQDVFGRDWLLQDAINGQPLPAWRQKLRWIPLSWAAVRQSGGKTFFVALIAYFLIVSGFYIFVGGTYASIQSIVDSYAAGTVGSAFSCADNSG
ncbi:unnamed protein product [Parajaminaea phylloscopi]